jgi:ATP synthase F1 gamma subunit
VEKEYADRLNISRTPVREALRMLEMEELVEYVPRVGVTVKRISKEDVLEIFKIRHHLEVLAATEAMDNITEEEIKDIEIKIDEKVKYEPSASDVLDVLIPKYIKGIMYGVFVEAFTSEQNARMTAMDNATKNADEMLQKLNLYYNRARQAAITQEISEIVGGASALK